MNPGENNPSTNAGAGLTPGVTGTDGGDSLASTTAASSASVTPSLDLTNMGTSSDAGLSMADSLASAQDNLTSAGMAAQSMQTDTIGMDQITATAPSATMATPDEPLVPAAPVPGSIGSVTSVPPLASADQMPGMAFTTTETVTTTTTGQPMAGMATDAGQPAAPAMGMEQPAAAPYNPFAAPVANPAQTSSANVPTSLQPPVEKFSPKGEGKKLNMNLLTWILGGLAVLFAVTTIIFVVLWQQAENDKEIVYLPPVSEVPVTDAVSLLNCSREDQVIDGAGAFAGLQSMSHSVTASFKNDELGAVELVNGYVFMNEEAAGAMREFFDGQMASFGEMANELGVAPIEASFDISGSVVTENLSAEADQLVGGYVASFMLDGGTGTVEGSLENVRAVYEGQGFTCSAE